MQQFELFDLITIERLSALHRTYDAKLKQNSRTRKANRGFSKKYVLLKLLI